MGTMIIHKIEQKKLKWFVTLISADVPSDKNKKPLREGQVVEIE